MRRRGSLLGAEERRGLTLAAAGCEIRADDTGAQRFVGHAAVFDTRTAIGNPLTWGFYEEIAPGAFTKTLSEGDARFLIDHDSYYVVSRVSADTLDLAQDKVGLAVDSALDQRLSYVGDLITNLDNKNITGMSFGFYVVKDDWTVETVELSDGNSADVEVRRILEVRLVEVSAVTFPAYEETDAGLRHSLVPALRHRGDAAAIDRVARHRPDLAALLRDDDAPRPITITTAVGTDMQETARQVLQALRGDGATANHSDDTEQHGSVDDEPGESTRDDDSTTTDDTVETEPAASTREHEPPIEARMRALAARYGLPRSSPAA